MLNLTSFAVQERVPVGFIIRSQNTSSSLFEIEYCPVLHRDRGAARHPVDSEFTHRPVLLGLPLQRTWS